MKKLRHIQSTYQPVLLNILKKNLYVNFQPSGTIPMVPPKTLKMDRFYDTNQSCLLVVHGVKNIVAVYQSWSCSVFLKTTLPLPPQLTIILFLFDLSDCAEANYKYSCCSSQRAHIYLCMQTKICIDIIKLQLGLT